MSRRKILIIYTGGTIGMIKNPITDDLSNVDFKLIMEHVPEINRLSVDVDSISFDDPIDSSEIKISDWIDLAKIIEDNYSSYDGFVVLHGTDTMAYSASALSFMFSGLKKPVIFTGSQLPIGVVRTDGKDNLLSAIEVASSVKSDGTPMIQEVVVYFDTAIFRGNRSTKVSASLFEAFKSPNYPRLGQATVEIEYQQDRFYKSEDVSFSVNYDLNNRIVLVKLFPGIKIDLYRDIFSKKNVDGIVLESFGSGNTPSIPLLEELIAKFIADGGVVVNITQCSTGKVVHGLYETSSIFAKLGVVSGHDLTTESAITKLMVNLVDGNPEETKRKMSENLRGELSI